MTINETLTTNKAVIDLIMCHYIIILIKVLKWPNRFFNFIPKAIILCQTQTT